MNKRLAIIGVAAVLLVALFFLLRPAPSPSGPQTVDLTLSIAGGKMTPAQINARQDDKVTLRLSSDKLTKFHLHGYDLERDIAPGAVETITFDAKLTGQFEIEDEATSTELGKLVVEPR